jgi:hypothetical protein
MNFFYVTFASMGTTSFLGFRNIINLNFRRAFTMTTVLSREPRRFAPLKEGAVVPDGVPKLRGIVFDVDGTLW